MSDFVKPFHLSPFEENINLKANRNWDDLILYTNNRNNGSDAFGAMRWASYGCRVYNDANISVSVSGVQQALTFNSERYDTYGMHSTSVNPSRLTAPRAGTYNIFGQIEYASNSTGVRFASIRLDGATYISVTSTPAVTGGDTTHCCVSTQYYLNANQFIELMANQTSGGALNVLYSGNTSPEFGMVYVGE